MNDVNKQKEIQKDLLKTDDEETKYDQPSKNDLAKELKEGHLGDKLLEMAQQEPQQPSKWKKFMNRVKRIFYYI